MFKSKIDAPGRDEELESLEQGATGRLLYTMGQQIKPRPEFASRVEERLRQSGPQPATQHPHHAPPQRWIDRRPPSLAVPGVGRRRIGLALSGVALGVLMVVVLGLLMLPGADRGATHAQQVPSVLAGSPLGKGMLMTLWGADHRSNDFRVVDPATGQMLPGYPPILISENSNGTGAYALSPDSGKLAVIESLGQIAFPSAGGTSYPLSADVLHLIDLKAWRDLTTTLKLPFPAMSNDSKPHRGWVDGLAFSRDGSRLVMSFNQYKLEYSQEQNPDEKRFAHTLLLVDANTGKIMVEKEIEFDPSFIEFIQDGSRLFAYGQSIGSELHVSKPGPLQVLLLDASTLDVQWSQTLDDVVSGTWCIGNCAGPHDQMVFESWTPAVVPSHDRRKLYILHADVDKLTTVDLDARTVRSTEVREAQSWFERLLDLTASKAEAKGRTSGAYKRASLSHDGTQLYITGYTLDWKLETGQKTLSLQVIDINTGRKAADYGSDILSVKTSPDGKYLYLGGREWPDPTSRRWNKVVDAKSLQHIATITDWSVIPTRRLGGEPIILATASNPENRYDVTFGVLDPETFQVAHSWKPGQIAYWVTTP